MAEFSGDVVGEIVEIQPVNKNASAGIAIAMVTNLPKRKIILNKTSPKFTSWPRPGRQPISYLSRMQCFKRT